MAGIYKTDDGARLDVGTSTSFGFIVGWSDDETTPYDAPLSDESARSDRLTGIAFIAAEPFCDCGRGTRGELRFSSERRAKQAKSAANAALLADRDGRQWPDWAVKAYASGWKAPKGWKP
jgi:hypothetical protein